MRAQDHRAAAKFCEELSITPEAARQPRLAYVASLLEGYQGRFVITVSSALPSDIPLDPGGVT